MSYDQDFYEMIHEGALISARIIAPLVHDIFGPKSVIDIGCGTSAWLTAFREIDEDVQVFGVDGEYNQFASERLGGEYEAFDLSQPFYPLFKYDLAITLEVAEHLDEQYADTFVQSITRCSDNILWSAAVPGQRGVHHVNEQFPSYWIPKFEALGYKCNGEFRKHFWYDERIENWYRQNILLFSKHFDWDTPVEDLIHYNNYSNYDDQSFIEKHALKD